ncbi:MAG: hypothetical protein U0325_08575 [Polyangiales bacterium]
MIDLALHRLRLASPASDLEARRAQGVALLTQLQALAARVEALLPDLATLHRVRSPPRAVTLYVGWAWARGGALGPRFVIALESSALVARWGYGREGPRGRFVAEGTRRRRALGDALLDHLSVLRAAGAALHLRDDGVTVSETEWARGAGGSAAFSWHLQGLDDGEILARRVAEAVGRLASLARHLGAFDATDPSPAVGSAEELQEGVRALRWEERAMGAGAAPTGLLPLGRTFAYDPVSGWFAPMTFAARVPASLATLRLHDALGPPSRIPGALRAGVDRGLHARLSRWMAARGERDPDLAARAEVFVAGPRVPRVDEVPALESLLTACLGDASGDVAVSVAAMLRAVTRRERAFVDPVSVAAEVPVRLAPSAARGVARLREHGVVGNDDDALRACLAHPALRPVLALAVERALGGLEVFPDDAPVRIERASARSWELAGLLRHTNLEAISRRFERYALAQGVVLPAELVRALIVGLRTKPFAVLAGVSGTGKTRVAVSLARFFTEGVGADAPRVAVVPVRPDWLDSRGLLGWLNALKGVWEDTEALRVLLHARDEPSEPHFVILDEMNLARVEHYLAEVLSAMESGAAIPLHGRASAIPTADGARMIPAALRVPPNVFFLATVNVDETTHALSPKVIDRAWTWEFSPLPPSALARSWVGDRPRVLPASVDERAALLDPTSADDPVRAMVLAMGRDGVGARIDALYEALAAHGRPFGFRVVTEVLRFVQLCEREGIDAPPSWWLDHAVLGKVLPALSGPRRELEPALLALRAALEGVAARPTRGGGVADELSPRAIDPLPRSAEKVREMLRRGAERAWITFAR